MKTLGLYFFLYGFSSVFAMFKPTPLIYRNNQKSLPNLDNIHLSNIYSDDLCIFQKMYMVRKPFYKKIPKSIHGIIENTKQTIIKTTIKTNQYLRLIRSENILPTLLLSFTGGWIMNPSLSRLFGSTRFISASIITILVMSSSMVLNDLFDIEIDKINNPHRPLVTGDVTKKEAILFLSTMLGLSEYLNFRYLTGNLQSVTHIAIMVISLYTPVFKRKLFLKNISCAALVSFASSFAGFAANSNQCLNKNIALLGLASRMVFFGSLSNEILLDIIDYNGDKRNGIPTIPVVFGKRVAFSIVYVITCFNVLSNTMNLISLYDFKKGIVLLILSSELVHYLNSITNVKWCKENIYDDNTILYYVKQTVKPLLISLLYLCVLISI
uniref:UbiA prenyltransferase family protein n=1 Tax=viral metagenome TaxID=1070528 RepID=A0A6C0DLN0_9ZZZZ